MSTQMSADTLLLDPGGSLAVNAAKVNTLAYWTINTLHVSDTERKGQWGKSHKMN